MILSATNTYSGGTTISGGTLQLVNSTALGSSTVTIKSGGTLDLNGQTETVPGLSLLGGSVVDTLGSGSLTSTSAYDLESGSVSAVLAGSAGVAKTTTGTVVLSGANTYSGGTTISTGTLQIGNGGSSGNLGTGGVSDNGLARL